MHVPYGGWPSPVRSADVTAGSVRLGPPQLDGDTTYWLEARPDQGGRASVWCARGGERVELTPAPTYVRSTVHEYGGGEWAVADGLLAWSDFPDGAVWVRDVSAGGGGEPRRITPAGASQRYGDLRVHPDRGLVLAVREDHSGRGEPVNTVVALDVAGANPDGGRVVCAGADFYAGPELSGAGRLAWVEWQHPAMPWDATAVRVGDLDGAEPVTVAGEPDESALFPRWLPGGDLVFVSDRSDWWNLYRWSPEGVAAVCPRPAEFCPPMWVLGMSPYAVVDDDRLLVSWQESDGDRLGLVSMSTGTLTEVPGPGRSYGGVAVAEGRAAVLVGDPTAPRAIVAGDLSGATWTTLRRSFELEMPAAALSVPEPVTWEGPAGTVHGWFYPPSNAEVTADGGERPPLITTIHGGPTSAASTDLDLQTQYWTSRGLAVLDVDYSGSTGHGRAYRNRLRGRWGELDIADCVDGAIAMAAQGRADRERLAIMGGSAGGYTVLRALTTSDAFGAGISLYGVGDLTALATDTHKFESRYLDGLIGPFPAAADRYTDRSPLHHVDDLASPILLLQGELDKVVPPDQARTFADAARAKGLPVALIVFPDEGHGFRRAENIVTTLESTLSFLGRIFGFTPADRLPPLEIDNLPRDGRQSRAPKIA